MDLKDWAAIAAIIISLISVSICYWFYRAGDKRETLRDKQRANDTLTEIMHGAVDEGHCSLDEASEAMALFLSNVKGDKWIYMDKMNMHFLIYQAISMLKHGITFDQSRPSFSTRTQIDEDLLHEIQTSLLARKGIVPEFEWKAVRGTNLIHKLKGVLPWGKAMR